VGNTEFGKGEFYFSIGISTCKEDEKNISESLLYAGIGVCGGMNPPRGIRAG